jgi:hypothetical protein
MELREIGWFGVDWLKIKNQWRAFVNTVMNLRVPKTVGRLVASQEGLSFMEVVKH